MWDAQQIQDAPRLGMHNMVPRSSLGLFPKAYVLIKCVQKY